MCYHNYVCKLCGFTQIEQVAPPWQLAGQFERSKMATSRTSVNSSSVKTLFPLLACTYHFPIKHIICLLKDRSPFFCVKTLNVSSFFHLYRTPFFIDDVLTYTVSGRGGGGGVSNASVPTHCRFILQGKCLFGERDNAHLLFLRGEPSLFSSR